MRGAGLVGRDHETATVEGFLGSVDRRSGTLVLAGQPGIGKTAIWDTGVAAAADAGFRVLTARPAEAEAQAAWAALADLLAEVDDATLSDLPDPQRQALEAALLRAEPTEATAAEPRATWFALRSVVVSMARADRVLIAIDDAQWLDPASAAAVAFVARRLPPANAATLVATRPSNDLGLDREDSVRRLEVGPLSMPAVHQLVQDRLGLVLPRITLQRIYATSGGNPLFALELARLHADRGRFGPAGTPLRLPETLHELVASRVEAISPAVRETLVAVAAASRPSLGLLAGAHLDAGLADAETAQLVRVDGTRVSFTHPLLGSAAYDTAPSDVRRAVHERLATVTNAEESARHRALAARGPDAAVAQALEEASVHAARRGAPGTAAELAELAVQLTPDGDTARWNRELVVGEQLFRAGDTQGAARHLRAVHDEAAQPLTRAHAALLLAELSFEVEVGPRVLALADEAVALAGDDPQLYARAVITRSRILPSYSMTEAAAQARDALAVVEDLPSADPGLLANALTASAGADFECGLGLDRDRLHRARAMEELTVAPRVADRALAALASMLKYADDFEGARAALHEVRRTAEEEGDESSLPYAYSHLPQLELWAGRWDQAEAAAHEHLALAQRTGEVSQLRQAEYNLAQVAACRGHLDEARRLGLSLIAVSKAEGDPWGEMSGESVVGVAAIFARDYDDAVLHLDRAVELADSMGLLEPGRTRWRADHIEALLAAGQRDRAAMLLDEWEQRARRLDRVSALGSAARCRALLAGADGDHAAAMAAIDASLAQYERVDLPFERARTLLVAGRLHRRAKEKRAARERLTAAREVFAQLGARQFVAQANADLARIGLRPAAPLHLTETERRVAELAAQGMTTRQVAESLFLSAKTVESNLTRIYRKLNLRSRTELANWIAKNNGRSAS